MKKFVSRILSLGLALTAATAAAEAQIPSSGGTVQAPTFAPCRSSRRQSMAASSPRVAVRSP